jgi:hypothetical protein
LGSTLADSGIGGYSNGNPWTITGGRANITLTPINFASDSLLATNFGFNIPPNATINGIDVAVSKGGAIVNQIYDGAAQLAYGVDKSSPNAWTSGGSTTQYGSLSRPCQCRRLCRMELCNKW